MVLCLVTLTDLEMCRAGLSASAELLVLFALYVHCMCTVDSLFNVPVAYRV